MIVSVATLAASSTGYASTGRAGLALLGILALGASMWALGRMEAHR